MTAKTVFPDAQGMIYLLCPFCNASTLEPGKSFPIHKSIWINCPCGKSYELIVEHRTDFRKKTSLSGIYWKKTSPDVFQNGTVSDLTLNGCCLLAPDRHALHLGEHIQLVFRLDDPKRTKIEREAVVRRIKENTVGCQFIGTPAFDPELGFYVQDFRVPK
jgi:hypothetical protein